MKRFLLISFFLLLCTIAFPKPTGAFSIEPNITISFAKFEEYIYDTGDSYAISCLTYEAKPLYQFGINSEYQNSNFLIFGSFNMALQRKCGNFYDADFTSDGIKKNLCIFENNALTNITSSFRFLYKFTIKKNLSLSPIITLNYAYNSFIGTNGYGYFGTSQYSKTGVDVPWNSKNARKAKRVSRISYNIQNFYIFCGLGGSFSLNSISFELASMISPYTYTYAMDQHFDDSGGTQGYTLQEVISSFFSNFYNEIKITYFCTSKTALSLKADFTFRPITKGEIWDSYQPAGSKLSIFNISIGCKHTF